MVRLNNYEAWQIQLHRNFYSPTLLKMGIKLFVSNSDEKGVPREFHGGTLVRFGGL
jgi:hypothetical protein